MNKLKTQVAAVMMALAVCTLPIASVALVGCTGGCAALAPGADPIVVRAEQTAAFAFEAMDLFLKMEENNREALRQAAPEVEKVANRVRVDGKSALVSLRDATKAYKTNRTPENKANLDTWMAVVEELRAISTKYLVAKK